MRSLLEGGALMETCGMRACLIDVMSNRALVCADDSKLMKHESGVVLILILIVTIIAFFICFVGLMFLNFELLLFEHSG